ncbi:hypothetical protein BDL97_12G028500 [Sphagnum fallax]|nr:hypothetical protein BDL97_12G028500 [Sphagnum fallax]
MIEYFSKWLELVPLLDYNSEGPTYAFLDMARSRFRAPAEVFIDQGKKLCGEFQELCDKSLIDHHTTSQDHHEAYKLFSPYFLFFNCEPKLPTLIRQNAMVIVNMDDINVWIQACEQ